jgi:aldose 1-epimerase
MKRERYGFTEDGRPVDVFTLTNAAGMRVCVLTLGCIIARLEVPDRDGKFANVVLGLDSVADYLHRSPHFGAIAGRFANRIARGRFTIDGNAYQLETNAPPNTLHGGRHGLDKVIWQADGLDGEALVLRTLSPDGDGGFPGNLAVEVTYRLGAANDLRIDYAATTDKPTIINLTNHSYFNLAGEGSGDVLCHVVSIEADQLTPTDATQIPTGEIRPVSGTVFDFTRPRSVGECIRAADEQLLIARGYDHNWVLRPMVGDAPRLAARALEPLSGRVLEVLTDAPGLQFYTGNSLTGALVGPSGRAYRQGDGFCFETQLFPDAPNQPGFPPAVLRPGERFHTTTIFRFATSAAVNLTER